MRSRGLLEKQVACGVVRQTDGQGVPALLAELAPRRADQFWPVGMLVAIGNQQDASERVRLGRRQKQPQEGVIPHFQLAQLHRG